MAARNHETIWEGESMSKVYTVEKFKISLSQLIEQLGLIDYPPIKRIILKQDARDNSMYRVHIVRISKKVKA
jgi:hypothetical protein